MVVTSASSSAAETVDLTLSSDSERENESAEVIEVDSGSEGENERNSESIEEVIELNDSDSEDEMMSRKEGGAFPAAALAAAVSFDLGSDTDDDAEEDDDKKGKESAAAAAASSSGPGGKHERDDDEEEDDEDDDSDVEWQDEKKTYDSSGSQRRSKRDKGESERKRPPPPSSPEEYADVARERYESREGFTFDSTRRPPANSSQHSVARQFLNDFCVSIVMLLIARNLILLPVGILFGFVNHASDLLSMNDGNPHIYYLFWPGGERQGGKRRKKRDKIGCAGEGKKRYTYYWNEFKENMPAIISLLNINAIPACVQTLVTAAILKGLAAFVPDQLPVTIADATRLEMTGLPVCTTLFFWSMVKGFDEEWTLERRGQGRRTSAQLVECETANLGASLGNLFLGLTAITHILHLTLTWLTYNTRPGEATSPIYYCTMAGGLAMHLKVARSTRRF
ncbi:hypothetical protein THAOC_01908, partial [Thalassiosira oceanica]